MEILYLSGTRKFYKKAEKVAKTGGKVGDSPFRIPLWSILEGGEVYSY